MVSWPSPKNDIYWKIIEHLHYILPFILNLIHISANCSADIYAQMCKSFVLLSVDHLFAAQWTYTGIWVGVHLNKFTGIGVVMTACTQFLHFVILWPHKCYVDVSNFKGELHGRIEFVKEDDANKKCKRIIQHNGSVWQWCMLCLSIMFHKHLNTARTNVKVSLIASAFVHESVYSEAPVHEQP